jgi:hypothetical protein
MATPIIPVKCDIIKKSIELLHNKIFATAEVIFKQNKKSLIKKNL